jgi:hypothetical protein
VFPMNVHQKHRTDHRYFACAQKKWTETMHVFGNTRTDRNLRCRIDTRLLEVDERIANQYKVKQN